MHCSKNTCVSECGSPNCCSAEEAKAAVAEVRFYPFLLFPQQSHLNFNPDILFYFFLFLHIYTDVLLHFRHVPVEKKILFRHQVLSENIVVHNLQKLKLSAFY